MIRKTTLTVFSFFCFALSFAQTANFTATVTSGCAPLVVNFQDQSSGASSWFWDFGNGATATLQNPSTTYFVPGTYTVTLTVKNGASSNTLTRTQYITVYGKPAINFTVNDSIGCFPHQAQFTDLSGASPGTVNSNWLWDFGDGSQGTTQNPLHVYTTAGNYTVTLKVTNNKGCYTVINKTSYIKIAGGVKSAFTNTQPTVCRPPFNISFTSSSTGPGALAYYWDFGDGNSSTLQNPVHNYTAPGNYVVRLATTSTDGCSDTLRKDTVLNILNINTKFNAPDSICINTPVSFQNTSTPAPVSSSWTFGDGGSSTAVSPIHAFSTIGTYTVRLLNTYSYCTDSFSKTIKTLPKPIANFTSDVTSKCKPSLAVNFQDQSTNAVSWSWDFGDGATSTQQNPSHTYSGYGRFDVRLVVTNNLGCTDTLKKVEYIKIEKPVIEFPQFPIEGCIPFNVTLGANITTLDVVNSYLWDFGDASPTSTATNPSHTYPVQGAYTISLTITTSTGCTETLALAKAVTVGRKPVVNFSATPTNVCAFQTVQFTDLTNEADKWEWEFGDGGGSSGQHPTHFYSDTGVFSVKLYATNSGCRDSFTIPNYIRVKPPIAKFGYQTTCANRYQFNFLDSSIGATSWFWEFGDGTTSNLQNPPHVFPAFGNYDVKLTVGNDTCSHTLTKSIRVFNENPDFHATATEACKIAQIQLIPSSGNEANIVGYYWDAGNGFTSSGPNLAAVTAAYIATGVYSVTLVTTDIYGCKDTAFKPNYIRINGPVANFTSLTNQGCKGMTTTFNDVSTTDGIHPIVSWKFEFGDSTTQSFTVPPLQHVYSSVDTFDVKMIVTDAAGCSDSLFRPGFVITSSPKADFFADDTASCPGGRVQFRNSTKGYDYRSFWDLGDGTTTPTQDPGHVYVDTGHYNVKLVITDHFGCKDSITRPNYIYVSRPYASFTMDDSVSSCTPFDVQFTNTSQFYRNSLWDLGGGMSTLPNPVQFYNSPGIYPIKLIVESPGGCLDSAFGSVRVFDTAGSRVTYLPLNGCKPLGVDLNAFSPGPMTYTWDFGDGVLITNNSTSINHIYNFFGDFTPKVIMSDASGCVIPVTGLDTIHIKGAAVKFGFDKSLLCDSGLVRFTDSTLYNDSLSVYNWDFGDGGISHLQNPSHYFTSPGNYTVMLNVQTQNSCVDTFRSKPIKIIESPLISIGGDSTICVNDLMQHLGVFNRPDTSAVQWLWNFPNGNSSGAQNPAKQQYPTAGNFVVRAQVVNSSGCRDSATKNILVYPLPNVTLPSVITMQVGFPITIPATYTSNVIGYTWAPATTLNCTDCPQPIVNPKSNTKYTVSFVDSNGCRNSGQVQVVVICKNANVYIPNTFSPNNDGSNDVFYVRGRGLDRVKSLRIFNRWGEVVFEKTNFPVNEPMYGWDGKYKGNKPIPDVYVYQVEVFCDNSEIIRFDGNIALIQ